MTRDWIIAVLKSLPVWCWPVFLWDVARVKAWWASLPIGADTLLTVGVTRQGRVIVTNLIEGARPSLIDGAQAHRHVDDMDLDRIARAFAAFCRAAGKPERHQTVTGTWLDGFSPLITPAGLDPG